MQEILNKFGIALIIIILFCLLIGFVKDANAKDYSTYTAHYNTK